MAVRADGREAVTHYRLERALPRPHAAARAARDRAHAPDPRAPGAHRPSAGRRPGLRRPAHGSAGRQRRPADGAARRSSARRCMRRGCARASGQRQAARVRGAAAGGLHATCWPLLERDAARRAGPLSARGCAVRRLLRPDWPAPPRRARGVRAARAAASARRPGRSLNLGAHVGDDPARCARTAGAWLRRSALPAEPLLAGAGAWHRRVWRPMRSAPAAARRRRRRSGRRDRRRPRRAGGRDHGGRLPAGAVLRPRRQRRRRGPCRLARPGRAACWRPPWRRMGRARPGAARLARAGHRAGAVRGRRARCARRVPGRTTPRGGGGLRGAMPRGRWHVRPYRRSRGERLQALGRRRRCRAGTGARLADPARFFSHRRDAPRPGGMAAWSGSIWRTPHVMLECNA